MFWEPQHLGSGQMTQHHTTNGTQPTFKNTTPGKESRLLLWTKIVHPRPIRILYVDRNMLPNNAQLHVYLRVDSRACTRHQREWYLVTGTYKNNNAVTTKTRGCQPAHRPHTSSTYLLHEMQVQTGRLQKWKPNRRCSPCCPNNPSSAAPRTTATAAELISPHQFCHTMEPSITRRHR